MKCKRKHSYRRKKQFNIFILHSDLANQTFLHVPLTPIREYVQYFFCALLPLICVYIIPLLFFTIPLGKSKSMENPISQSNQFGLNQTHISSSIPPSLLPCLQIKLFDISEIDLYLSLFLYRYVGSSQTMKGFPVG